ncbi:cyanoexosortase B system-associated protein [Plectonema cf. radiosum LEGE 06105]|uniref:Cyanoexosortase B system-associated protein n=1 Tax=Plectonema cf. radiosum LEGE 06105 TaxID=945769 RepID=A0A8J7K1C9_9CYAN|nr:cyanoexosortase B system-associated protein [Plectonema radiosum]MBE9213262.1 cyanoexosortase B system-associated protein [Plectonema cf. radiosum LEGE 06105]
MISLSRFFKERQFLQIAALILLLLLLGIGALPGYLQGNWRWKQPPPITNLRELKELRKTGLILPGWKITQQQEQKLGSGKWSLQVMEKENGKQTAILLLLPQNGPKEQPQVEWSEIDSWGRMQWGEWQVAQSRQGEFTVKQSQLKDETKVKAKFFRASTKNQSFAVLQWYAMPNSGHFSPLNWFWADQLAQWHKQRVPWVAVSLFIPMEPFGQVETTWQQVKSIAQTVQTKLFDFNS